MPTPFRDVVPQPAATVVLARPMDGGDGLEVLLTHRPATMAFAAGMHVFPGGRVDEADADPLALANAGPGTTPAHVAAVREVAEEVGIALHAADLIPLSRWVTPPVMDRRFDVSFFVAPVPADVTVRPHAPEVATHDWFTPAAALAAMAAGQIEMWQPTSCTLQQLRYVTTIDAVRDRLAAIEPAGPIVIDDVAPDVVRITMPCGGGVAGQPVHAYLVGRRRFVLVDPGDPTGPGLEAAMALAVERGGVIEAVALTHADPDHAGGSEWIAEVLHVPIFASPGRLAAGDVPILAVAAPGPTPEHLAFIVGDRNSDAADGGLTVLAGDLDGIRGARMVPGPPDHAAWRTSLAELRSLAPDAPWFGGHPAPG